ncbi:MAG: hypothetical protein LBH44_07720 [Treponema sp.]|jgi:hypothetical protein|nr:hypothetical protein [Treponema sp.]
MANINWPAELPATLLMAGLSKQPQNNVIRTSMDAGPKKARRRYTARSVKFSGRQVFSALELDVFEQFYQTILADGVLRFNFTDPVSLETGEFRFAADYTVNALDGYFEVGMQLERMQ